MWFHNATTQRSDRRNSASWRTERSSTQKDLHTKEPPLKRTCTVKRTSLEADECPIARSLDEIGDWWSLLIIRDAFLGKRRFGEFQKSLGVAKNILTTRLHALGDDGILTTGPASDGSAYQD